MKKLYGLVLILGLALVLAACGGSDDDKNASDKSNEDKNGEATEGMIPETLVIGFVPSQDSDTIADTVKPLADRLGEELGIPVEGKVMTDYNALVEAMGANQ